MKKTFESGLQRRDVLKVMGGAAGFSLLNPHLFWLKAYAQESENHRLSYRAFSGAHFEGEWTPRLIEGQIPIDLKGTLFRNGPGQKEVFGVQLRHLFDGDAYLTAFQFENGAVSGFSKFLDTPERELEQKAKAMRYHDFGTTCPNSVEGYKNAPAVNFFAFGRETFALSEGALPVKVDAETFDCQSEWTFSNSLSSKMTFTAHPRKDPVSGDIYAYGITQSLWPKLKIVRLPSGSAQFEEVTTIDMGGVYPVHDFIMTENYLIFVLPPAYVSLWSMIRKKTSIAEAIRFEGDKPMRIFVVRKDGTEAPRLFESSVTSVIFHHCNAVESQDGRQIKFVAMEVGGVEVFQLLEQWSQLKLPTPQSSWMTAYTLDLESGRVLSQERLTDGRTIDFPAIDGRELGLKLGKVYALQMLNPKEDALAFNSLVSWDLNNNSSLRVDALANQVFGEPVFVEGSNETRDWLVHLGYDGDRDETFLDIRRPSDLALEARVWTGQKIPIGFHGNFIPKGEI